MIGAVQDLAAQLAELPLMDDLSVATESAAIAVAIQRACGRLRHEAVYNLTRVHSRETVARMLDTSVANVNMLVVRHNRALSSQSS